MTAKYPGSKMPIKTFDTLASPPKPRSQETFEEFILGKPETFLVNGKPQEFYKLGSLAGALNRKQVTIRKWESDGVIPNPTFILPSRTKDVRGQRRLYTKEQIMGLRTIAEEEGLLETTAGGQYKKIEQTNFRERALKLFKDLEGK